MFTWEADSFSSCIFLDALSGSPIEICKRFVVFDGEQKFAQIDPWFPKV